MKKLALSLLLLGCGLSHPSPDVADASVADAPLVDVPIADPIPDADRPDAPIVLPHWEGIWEAIACTEHTATRTSADDVLIVGNCTLNGAPTPAVVYDGQSRTAFAVDTLEPRHGHTAVALPDGVLVIGGFATEGDAALATTELFEQATNLFRAGPTLREPRAWAGAIVSGGRIIVAGGRSDRDGSALLASVEGAGLSEASFTPLPPLTIPREGMLLRERGGVILAIGGVDSDRESSIEHLGTGITEPLPSWCPSLSGAPGELVVVCSSQLLDVSAGVRVVASVEHGHMSPAVARMADGALLVLGSSPWTHNPPAFPERIADGASTLLPNPMHSYLWPTATALENGTVLVVGEEGSELLVP